MYLSRITITPGVRPTELLKVIGRSQCFYHQQIWEEFFKTDGESRDFIYRIDFNRLRPEVYVISQREPMESSIWQVETKRYEPIIHEGQKFRFSTRVNPTISRPKIRERDGKSIKPRHDVVMDMKWTFKQRGETLPPQYDLIQSAGILWLNYQASLHGFAFDENDIIIDNYTGHKLVRRGSDIRFSTLDFQGFLTVTDTKKFESAISRGIGSQKGFGCGLLLLQRV
jgi:CRISPR system Cascade subunit CasE